MNRIDGTHFRVQRRPSRRMDGAATGHRPCVGCGKAGAVAAGNDAHLAPIFAGWAGKAERKPHDYRITAAIPHLDTLDPLKVCIEVLRAQTERPYIVVVDTGSPCNVRAELEAMRAEDLEVHFIAGNGYRHASEPVALALDFAQDRCPTDLLFHTHADCFLRRHDFLADMARRCTAENPVIGYRMSPRKGVEDWREMVSHTATTLFMPAIRSIGARWSMQRMHSHHGVPWQIDGIPGGWPDTETGFGFMLRDAGIVPEFIGDDINQKRQVDDNLDHVRSYAGSKLYEESYHARAASWMIEAIADARARIANP